MLTGPEQVRECSNTVSQDWPFDRLVFGPFVLELFWICSVILVLDLRFVWDLEIVFWDLGGAQGGEGIDGGLYCTIGRTMTFEISFKLGNSEPTLP
jgi:hypothetical protein